MKRSLKKMRKRFAFVAYRALDNSGDIIIDVGGIWEWEGVYDCLILSEGPADSDNWCERRSWARYISAPDIPVPLTRLLNLLHRGLS